MITTYPTLQPNAFVHNSIDITSALYHHGDGRSEQMSITAVYQHMLLQQDPVQGIAWKEGGIDEYYGCTPTNTPYSSKIPYKASDL